MTIRYTAECRGLYLCDPSLGAAAASPAQENKESFTIHDRLEQGWQTHLPQGPHVTLA